MQHLNNKLAWPGDRFLMSALIGHAVIYGAVIFMFPKCQVVAESQEPRNAAPAQLRWAGGPRPSFGCPSSRMRRWRARDACSVTGSFWCCWHWYSVTWMGGKGSPAIWKQQEGSPGDTLTAPAAFLSGTANTQRQIISEQDCLFISFMFILP